MRGGVAVLLGLGLLVPTVAHATSATNHNARAHITNLSTIVTPTLNAQERANVPQNRQYDVKISFPKEYIAPSREGQEKEFYFCITLEGKPEGASTSEKFYYWIKKAATIQRGKTITLTTLDFSGDFSHDGKTYTDVKPTDGAKWYLYYQKGHNDYSFSVTGSRWDTTYVYNQRANLALECSYAENSIILNKDKDKIPVHYYVEWADLQGNNKKKCSTHNAGLLSETTIPFEASKTDSGYKDDFLYEYNGKTSLNWLIIKSLGLWYPDGITRNGRYTLIAELQGKNDEETARLKKCYALTLTGDELNGWKLVLSSNIKEGKKVEETDTGDFETVYEDTADLFEGETRVKTQGVKGKKTTTTPYYYVLSANQEEEIIEQGTPSETTTDPVNQVVLRGTKKRPQPPAPPVPDVPDTPPAPNPQPNKPTPQAPDTPNSDGAQGQGNAQGDTHNSGNNSGSATTTPNTTHASQHAQKLNKKRAVPQTGDFLHAGALASAIACVGSILVGAGRKKHS